MRIALAFLLCIVEAYLLGSVNTGILVSKLLYHDDVRTHGSGSAGMTNMLRTYGKKAAAITAVGDVGKGLAAVLLAKLLFGWLVPGLDAVLGAYLAMAAAVLGHLKPIYFHFKGGKGILVAGGAILGTQPPVFLALMFVFFCFFIPSRMVSLGSIAMACAYPVLTFLYGWFAAGWNSFEITVSTGCAAVVAAIVIYMHRSNIERLKNGTEYRFTKNK